MKARVDTITGDVLSYGEGRYSTDPPEVVVVEVEGFSAADLRKLVYSGGVVTLRPQAELDAIDAADTAEASIAGADAEIIAAGWTPGELTRRLSGGLAVLSRVVLALAAGTPPAAADLATLATLEPELARYELPAGALVGTVKALADARAEVADAVANGRKPDLSTLPSAKDLK